jgi:dTDP-4-dehydrorhamnose 3,5-epimerase
MNRNMLLLPAGIGNSILSMSSEMMYYYKQNTHFKEGSQFTIKWNDPEWNIWWPIKKPILSRRDEKGGYVNE